MKLTLSLILILGLTVPALGQQDPERLQQHKIIVGGQNTVGVYLYTPEGQLEFVKCPKPEQWTTFDRKHRGWVCRDFSTGAWIMNAIPPTYGMGSNPDLQSRPAPEGSGHDKEHGQGINDPKSDFPSSQKPEVQKPEKGSGTPKVSPGVRVLKTIRNGASRTDEVILKYRLFKRNGVMEVIPCRTEKEKMIPAVILGTCGGIVR